VLQVECYAGHRADEEPRLLRFDRRTVEVVEVLERSQAPDHRRFTVRGDDGTTYRLRQDAKTGRWTFS